MSDARRLGLVVVAAFSALVLDCPSIRASGEVLAEADFESDLVGAMARPHGPPTVSEEVYDDSTTTGGVGVVELYGTGKRFLLSDAGTVNQVKAIRMPLSATATSGLVSVSVDLSAAQEATGGVLTAHRPDEQEWYLHVAFGGDGKFRVHDQATTHAYTAGATYRVTATLELGTSSTTVDYHVENLSNSNDSFSVNDCTVEGAPGIGSLRFATAGAADGSFSIDNVLVTRP